MTSWSTDNFLGGEADRWLSMRESVFKDIQPFLSASLAQLPATDLTALSNGAKLVEKLNSRMRGQTESIVAKILTENASWDMSFSAKAIGLQAGIAEEFMFGLSPAWESLQKSMAETQLWTDAFKKNAVQQFVDIWSGYAADIAEGFRSAQRYGLPKNLWDLDDDLTVRDIRLFLDEDAYPLYHVPRASIVNSLIRADSLAQRRNVLNNKASQIVEDCESALDTLDQKSFKDEIEQVRQSIGAYEHELVRPAQTGVTIVLDSLFNRALRLKCVQTEIKNQGELGKEALAKLKTSDFLVWAPVRRAHLEFDGSNGAPPPRLYSRHGTVHSVQKRQYSKRNVVFALLVVTSLMVWVDERESLID